MPDASNERWFHFFVYLLYNNLPCSNTIETEMKQHNTIETQAQAHPK